MSIRPKNKRVNRAWLNEHLQDTYVQLAQKEGYRARAAYKLKEIDEVLGLVKPGQVVVDLGSAPGAWSQYLRRRFAPAGAAAGALNGTIIALDILPMEAIEGVHFIQGDFREDATDRQRPSWSVSGSRKAGQGLKSACNPVEFARKHPTVDSIDCKH
jgi:23S rRNA (uridine2552-2'-O)-methyltransferase